jgi:AraC family transcriptional activator of pobA
MPISNTPKARAARIDCALQERTIGERAGFSGDSWFAFYVESGSAVAFTRNGEFDLMGPALAWGPLDADTRLRIAPGSVGSYLFVGSTLLNDAVGATAEAAELRLLAQQHLVASLDHGDPHLAELDMIFERITAEVGANRLGGDIALSAYVRLLLLTLWRNVDEQFREQVSPSFQTSEIYRFRSLVEAHFRSRWRVGQYAEALGITYDRLHDLCIRSVGKPPTHLLRDRCLHEAQTLLLRTTLSVERVSAMLGFGSASQFNHFFKSFTGETPSAFRRRMSRRNVAETPAEYVLSFADWP